MKGNYATLSPTLYEAADIAHSFLKTHFGFKHNASIEKGIDPHLSWAPTFFWSAKTEYIACEVSDRPLPKTLTSYIANINRLSLHVRMIVAVSASSSIENAEFQKERAELKKLGIGFLYIDKSGVATLELSGVPIPLAIIEPEINLFKSKLRVYVRKAFDLYMRGDPVHGVQDLGQTVEDIIYGLGKQAKLKGKLTKGGFDPTRTRYYPASKLVEDLMAEHVIANAILGRCLGFIDDRGKCSHRPKNIKEAQDLVHKLKGCWDTGLRILTELPGALKDKGYRLSVLTPC
jgi:hypothetical protein